MQLSDKIKALQQIYTILDPLEFTLEVPFGTNLCAGFNLLNNDLYVYIQSSNDSTKFILQAIIYDTFTSDLQFINNYKDGMQIPVNGGGNLLLDVWDWIANLFGVTQTTVVDMSKLKGTLSPNECEILGDDYNTISFRLLSMILHNDNCTWYEKHDYHMNDTHAMIKNMTARSLLFNLPIATLLPAIKQCIKMHYKCVVKHDIYANILPFLIALYKKCYYKSHVNIKNFMSQLWDNNKCEYSVLEKILLSANYNPLHNYMSIIHDEEITFIKQY